MRPSDAGEQFIVECIRVERDEMQRLTPRRQMIGPYESAEAALEAVEALAAEFDNVLAHALHKPEPSTP